MSSDPNEPRNWLIKATTILPKILTSDLSQGLPQQLEFASRVSDSACTVGRIEVSFRKPLPATEAALISDIRLESAEICMRLSAMSAMDALDAARPALDLVIDDFSFQLQEPLSVVELEVIDVTPPAAVGDEREILLYPLPNGYDQYKLSRNTSLSPVEAAREIQLRDSYDQLSQRTQDALDWYIKALHARFDVDRFIFYWVSFEILYKELGQKVEEPTRLRCQHELAECPKCGKPTSTYRQAATAQNFITSFGVDADVAKKLWNMRQLVHGAKSFLPEKLKELSELTQILRFVTLSALKKNLGTGAAQAPNVAYGAPSVSAFGLGGTRAINDDDLH